LAQGVGTAELAYLGDAVFEIMVREMLLQQELSFHDLSPTATKYVSATAQAQMYHRIFPTLTEEEQAYAKRGRNLHSGSRSKSSSVTDYRHATGLEALFGWLYLEKNETRLREIFELCILTV